MQINSSKNIQHKTHTKTTAELRKKIVDEHILEFATVKDLTVKYKLADSTVRDILKRFDQTGTVLYKAKGGNRRATISDIHGDYLRDLVDQEDEENILTLEQLRKKLHDHFPEDFPQEDSITVNALFSYVNKNLLLTLKRSPYAEATQEAEDAHRLRKGYCEELKVKDINYLDSCIFVDEAEFNACMVSGSARSIKGKKAHTKALAKRAKKITIIAAISRKKLESLQTAVVDTTADNFIFDKFIKQLLKLLDKEYDRPMVVVVDSATRFCHCSSNVKDIFEKSQHKLLFLPAKSPAFNPVETCFSMLKNHVKRNPSKEGSTMLNLICEAGDAITAEDCKSWILNCANNINRYMEGEYVAFDG